VSREQILHCLTCQVVHARHCGMDAFCPAIVSHSPSSLEANHGIRFRSVGHCDKDSRAPAGICWVRQGLYYGGVFLYDRLGEIQFFPITNGQLPNYTCLLRLYLGPRTPANIYHLDVHLASRYMCHLVLRLRLPHR